MGERAGAPWAPWNACPRGGGALALATVRAFAVRPLVVTSDQTAFSSPANLL